MFEFQNVAFLDILDIPELAIEKGRITSLTGPSGGGKTTLLKLLNKMVSPSKGHILFQGEQLAFIDSVKHRRQVTMLSQSPVIMSGTVRDNLIAGLKFQKRQIPGDDALAETLQKVQLAKELDSSAQNLSGGEKQRLALGRILLLDAEVYLLDEPSSALDDDTAEVIVRMVADFARNKQKTLVMVTHSALTASRYSDEIIHMSEGKCKRRPV
jgi:putative ABC transport system ATP-binding protein